MMLTPVFKSADPNFNHRAADDAARLVMAMDEDEARAFTTMVVADILWDDIEKNQRTLQSHLTSVVNKRIGQIAKAYSAMDDPTLIQKRLVPTQREEFGKSLLEISKATRNPYDWGYVFNESDFKRDPGTGRFQAKVRYTGAKPVKDKIARVTPNLPNPKKTAHLSARQKAEYQQGYQQVSTFLDTMRQSGLDSDSKIFATVQERGANGRTYVTEVSGTKVPSIDPESERFVGIEARPTSLRVGGASFGLVSALGGGQHAASQTGATADAVDHNLRSFADDWTGAGVDNPQISNARLYGRVEAGSRFLGQIAPAGSKLQMASAFGEFVGRQGPQAERVLGPRARTTMYRYRGTEKTPDKELTSSYNRALRGYDIDRIGPDDKKKLQGLVNSAMVSAERRKGSELTKPEKQALEARVTRNALGQSHKDSVEQTEAGQFRALAIAQKFMSEKVPQGALYDLQLKSGHTPPSEGVIIDSNGKIVTQAIGYGDDHYLPFNLKNLKGLRGGEYVRTRSVGGPTTEDIYTGLVTGAKRLTVVSRSGTFTIEFDDTFRGTRRYNDKAGRMVDRYGKLLDAIKSEQVERQPLDPVVRQEIAHGVEMEFGDWTSAREKRKIIGQREAEYKENPQLTSGDEARIEARVGQIGGTDEERNRVRAQLRNELLDQKSFNYRLNGDGYAAGIKALQEQFPYYIKDASHRATREGRFEGATDRGYVKPRYNRPGGALEGYFDSSVNGEGSYKDASGGSTGKFRADQMDYQNSRGRLSRNDPTSTTEQKPEVPGGQLTPTSVPATPAEVAADTIERAAETRNLTDAAVGLQSALAARIAPDKRGPMSEIIGMDPDQFRTWIASPANQSRFREQVSTVVKPVAQQAGVTDQLTAYDAAHGLVGGERFNRTSHMNTIPTAPYAFEGAAYMRGGNPAKKEAELARIAHRSKVPGFGSLAEMEHDEDFKEALGVAQKLRVVADQVAQAPPEQRGSFLQAIVQNDPTAAAMNSEERRLITNPEKVDQMVEDVNRAWAIRKLINRNPPTPAPDLSHKQQMGEPIGRLTPTQAPMPTSLQRANLGAQPDQVLSQASTYATMLDDAAREASAFDMDLAEELNEMAQTYKSVETADDLTIAGEDLNALLHRNAHAQPLIGRRIHGLKGD